MKKRMMLISMEGKTEEQFVAEAIKQAKAIGLLKEEKTAQSAPLKKKEKN